MPGIHALILLLLLSLSGIGYAQVYQSTDSEGNVTFSDTPSADSEEIVIPETNVGDSVKVPEPSTETEPVAPEPKVAVEQKTQPEAEDEDDYYRDGNRRRRARRYGHGR